MGVPATIADHEARFGSFDPYQQQEAASAETSPPEGVVYTLPPMDVLDEVPNLRRNGGDSRLLEVPYAPEMAEALNAYMALNGEGVAALHRAIESGYQVSRASALRDSLTEMLCLEILHRAHQGDGPGVERALRNSLRMLCGPPSSEARPVDLYGTWTWVKQILNALSSAVGRVAVGGETLETAKAYLDIQGWEAARRERMLQQQSWFVIQGWDLQSPEFRIQNLLLGTYDRLQAREMTMWKIRYEWVGTSREEQEAAFDALTQSYKYEYLRVMGPPIELQVVAVALDVLRYASEHGTLPPSLDDLVPAYRAALPIDFWSDAPFQYNVGAGEWVVYSVGRNKKDDEGESRKDISFRALVPPGSTPSGAS
jgi:hypothetical protein